MVRASFAHLMLTAQQLAKWANSIGKKGIHATFRLEVANIVEQDHRAIKRVTRPMINFKSFRSANNVLAGIELMHMIRKGQFATNGANEMSFVDQFYALAGQVRPV